MAAPKGNRFWEARSTHGRNPIYGTAEQLQDACQQYLEWNADNPLYKVHVTAFQGVVSQESVPVMRAMTIGAMCLFIGIDVSTWREWKATRKDFSAVIREVEQAIFQQKFEGASADLLNANIIARDLGLADKTELTGKDGGAIETKDTSITETARRMAFILASAMEKEPDAS